MLSKRAQKKLCKSDKSDKRFCIEITKKLLSYRARIIMAVSELNGEFSIQFWKDYSLYFHPGRFSPRPRVQADLIDFCCLISTDMPLPINLINFRNQFGTSKILVGRVRSINRKGRQNWISLGELSEREKQSLLPFFLLGDGLDFVFYQKGKKGVS